MEETSENSEQMMFPDFSDVTFSQGSEDGTSRSSSPDGRETERSGRPRSHVSRFQKPERNSVKEMRDTCFLISRSSSPSARLQQFVESRLVRRMEDYGSPEFDHRWSRWDIGSSPPICVLLASARLTSDSDSSGWPTPRTITGGPESAERKQELGRKRSGGGDLQAAAIMVGWRTPSGSDGEVGVMEIRDQAPLAYGEMTGSDVRTGKFGGLNPELSRWLMMFPEGWGSFADTEMRSSR